MNSQGKLRTPTVEGQASRSAVGAEPAWEVMQPRKFEATPEFGNSKAVMRRVLAVPKAELDALVERAAKESPRNNDRHAPGRKVKKTRQRSKR